ncbi:MAG: amidohydrolase [Deltaproteobacteria bacterium]
MDLRISGIQFDIAWENKECNIKVLEGLLNSVPSDSEVVLLPEMFTTGFSMNPQNLAESMSGPTVQWMQKKATEFNFILCGSIIISENNTYRNRFLWVTPEGIIDHYDKRHLFAFAGENIHYRKGSKRKTFTYKSWKFMPGICYDLRFPVWLKNNIDYHVLLNVANWPTSRAAHWNAFLVSRAIENQAYIFGLNRSGIDGENRKYSGDSSIYDYEGKCIIKLGENEGIITAILSMDKLMQYRSDFPFLKDQDFFDLTNLKS